MIKGVPRPSLTWYKNGEPLQQNQKYEIDELTGRLLFVTVDSEDSGNYILRADNSGMFSHGTLAPPVSRPWTDSLAPHNILLFSADETLKSWL